MRFKVASRQAEEVALGGSASMIAYLPVPVVVGVALLSGPLRWGYALGGFATLAVLLALNVSDLLAVRRNDLAHFTPASVLRQLLLAVLAISLMLLAVQGRSLAFVPLYLMPLLFAAVVGDRSFGAFVWSMTTAALAVTTVLLGIDGEVVLRTVVVHGSIWAGAMLVVDFALRESARHLGTSDGLARLASASNALHEWPADLPAVADLILAATGVDRFWLFSGSLGVEPVEILRWGAAPDVSQEGHVRALARADTTSGGDPFAAAGYVRVKRGTAELTLTLLVPDRTSRRAPTEPERVAAAVSVLLLMAQRAQRLEGLLNQAMTDPLTGLANRRQLYDELARQLSVSGRSGRPAAVAMLDLDHFKDINDRYGHHVGDETLRQMATLLDENTRRMDLVARYGGEEFAVVFPGLDAPQAALVMTELQHTVRAAMASGGTPAVTFSVGVAVWEEGEEPEHLLSRADRALYLAKEAGRDRVVIAAESARGS